MMRDRRIEVQRGPHISRHQRQIFPFDNAGTNRTPERSERIARTRDHQCSRSSIVETMDQSTFDWLVADRGGLRETRDDRVHHCAAFAGPQQMTWDAARLVHDDQRGILEEYLDINLTVSLDCRARERRLDLDLVA